MQSESVSRIEAAPAVGGRELVEGLLLVRASTLKVVRLQLAIERRDRRVALEAVDELVELDRRISDFLDGLPEAQAAAEARRGLDAQGRTLVREKFALAAGRLGPIAEPEGPPPMLCLDAGPDAPPSSSHWLAAGLVVLLAILVAGAFFFLSGGALRW